jgi:hypothetical protein
MKKYHQITRKKYMKISGNCQTWRSDIILPEQLKEFKRQEVVQEDLVEQINVEIRIMCTDTTQTALTKFEFVSHFTWVRWTSRREELYHIMLLKTH